jgi:uncharacterized protein YcbK (DUF882 family)
VTKMQQRGRGMRSFVLSLAVALAAAGPSFAQSTTTGAAAPQVIRGSSATPAIKKTAAVANQPNVVRPPARQVQQQQQRPTKPETLRASRYGGFAPAPSGPPPALDTTSPRTLNLVNFNTQEVLTVTYWSNGAYHRKALDQLNHFLRDTRDNAQTEMDPLLFDVLWHTAQIVGYGGSIEVLSAYRSPSSNAWLASVSRGVARDSQHMNGNAMDIRFPGVPVFQLRQAAYSLNMGGVGFYPRSGFVHLDTGPVRYW